MAAASAPVKRLLASFRPIGLTTAQVRSFLPAWWDDEASDEGCMLELQVMLARRLGVALDSLRTEPPRPRFFEVTRRFKTSHPAESPQLEVASAIGQSLALLVAASASSTSDDDAVSAPALRGEVLEYSKAVALEPLCSWSWKHGIPVVHLSGWPAGLRRPDAMCVRTGGRRVILIVRKELAPAKLAYLVAHEIGHLMLGHLKRDTVLIDDELPVEADRGADDEEERQADAYAMTLLGGETLRDACESLRSRRHTELTLAAGALQIASRSNLDSGQIILGWGRLTRDWMIASMALRYLAGNQPAPVQINAVAGRHIDDRELSEDNREHLRRFVDLPIRA